MSHDTNLSEAHGISRAIADLTLVAITEINRYKTIYFAKSFKVNSTGGGKLSERQFHILYLIEYLKFNNLSQISGVLELSDAGLSIIISKLVKNGLLYKKYPGFDDDKRKTYFYLTDEGMAVLKDFKEQVILKLAGTYELLSGPRKEMLEHALDCLLTFLPEINAAPQSSEEVLAKPRFIAEKIIQAVFKFSALLQKYNAESMSAEYYLSRSQFQVLFLIYAKKIDTIGELSKITGVSLSALSSCISKLEEEGWLSKEYPDNDGRRIYFHITSEGKNRLFAIKEHMKSFIVKLCDGMNEERRGTLYEGVKNLCGVFNSQ